MTEEIQNEQLIEVNHRIHEALKGVEARFDGSRLNIFTGRISLDGYGIGVAISIYPDSSIEYHLSKERPKDFDGYFERWDYHWGRSLPKVHHGRTHESRRHLSSVNPDDTHETRAVDSDDIRILNLLLDDYKNAKP